MSIGSNIKKYRRERDITQEDLAESLGISSRAVSHWECDRTAPDVSQIPALCRVLKVSSDELLGIDLARMEEEIDELTTHIYEEVSCLGRKKEAYLLWKDALKQYPNSFEIMDGLADAITWMAVEPSFTEDEKKEMFAEQGRLLRKIYDECTDERIRSSAVSDLAKWYALNGEEDKAVEIALTLPHMVCSRPFVMGDILKGSERIDSQKGLLFDLLQMFASYMTRIYKTDDGELLYSEDEMIRLHEKRIALFELLYEDGSYGFYNDDIGDSCETIAKYHAKNGRPDEALAYLERAAEAVRGFLAYAADTSIQSASALFLKGYRYSSGGVWYNSEDNDAAELLHVMEDSVFDGLRDNPEFVQIIAEMRGLCGKNM